jgi:hypothetical protein
MQITTSFSSVPSGLPALRLAGVERQLSITTWPAAPGPVPEWKNERISSACGTQISSEAIYAPGVRQQAAETSADLSSIGLADDRLNRIVQIYGLTPLMTPLIKQNSANIRFDPFDPFDPLTL